jgi:hypothetical protein
MAEYHVKAKALAPGVGLDLFCDDYYKDHEVGEEANSFIGDSEDNFSNEES